MSEYAEIGKLLHDYFTEDANHCVVLGVERHTNELPDPSLSSTRAHVERGEALLQRIRTVDRTQLDWESGIDLELAELMRLRPERVFFVGDSATDIETGRNAKMSTIAVTWGYRDADQLRAAGPDRIVSDPPEIGRVIAAEAA